MRRLQQQSLKSQRRAGGRAGLQGTDRTRGGKEQEQEQEEVEDDADEKSAWGIGRD